MRKKYKFSLVFMAILLVGNLSFCFVPFASVQTADVHFLCEETGHQNQPGYTFQLVANENNGNEQSNNSFLSCCKNHEAGNKIDTVKRQTLNNQPAYTAGENDTSKILESSNYSSRFIQLDSPPPEAKLVGSVYKKE